MFRYRSDPIVLGELGSIKNRQVNRDGQGLLPTLTNIYFSPLYSADLGAGGLQFPLYFCISQESPHYFPTHTSLPHTVKVHNLQDSHPPHHPQKRTISLSFKKPLFIGSRLVEREKQVVFCRLLSNGLSASAIRVNGESNVTGATFPKS